MDIDCPKCEENSELDCDDTPSDACDSKMYTCPHCEHEFLIGWYATAELR